jgi:hypothetical protein
MGINLIKARPAKLIGYVEGDDEASVIKAAI